MHIEEQTLTKGQSVERMKEIWNEMCQLWSYHAVRKIVELK